MTDKELILAEIERLKEYYPSWQLKLAMDDLVSFINSLPEKSVSSDLDKAATHHKEMVKGANRPETEFANTDFIAGAMWYKYDGQKSSDKIDFEQELYKHFGQVKDFTLGMRIAKYFYELAKER